MNIVCSVSVPKDNVSDRLEGKSKMKGQGTVFPKKLKFKPLTRKGMSVCSDHGWQKKKGFDSLTGKKKNRTSD